MGVYDTIKNKIVVLYRKKFWANFRHFEKLLSLIKR